MRGVKTEQNEEWVRSALTQTTWILVWAVNSSADRIGIRIFTACHPFLAGLCVWRVAFSIKPVEMKYFVSERDSSAALHILFRPQMYDAGDKSRSDGNARLFTRFNRCVITKLYKCSSSVFSFGVCLTQSTHPLCDDAWLKPQHFNSVVARASDFKHTNFALQHFTTLTVSLSAARKPSRWLSGILVSNNANPEHNLYKCEEKKSWGLNPGIRIREASRRVIRLEWISLPHKHQ